MIELIKERVEGGVYDVDAQRVAEAILARGGEECRTLRALCSQMLVAPHLAGWGAPNGESSPGHHPS